ncbi:hypothetical protein EKH80_06255 [Dyella choica]|uniref:Transmembrane protein n=2 Tax=Dyella choica TaxID=1927959 RepID=A0A3S0SAZ6_9GAMM|nr:hypothetical protein EKH80_06255 [Dyella choica]
MDTLHKLLGVWFILIVCTAYLPSASAKVNLPFTDLTIPGDSVRWACMLAIFLIGLIGHAIVTMLRRLSVSIAETEKPIAIFTYPSIATLGRSGDRFLLGIGLAFVQYMVAAQAFPHWQYLGGHIWLGVAFGFSLPMYFLGLALANWQRLAIEEIEAKPFTTTSQLAENGSDQ